jgi:hypothetical protein
MGSKVVRMVLLCFVGAHLQDVLLLEHRSYYYKGSVLLVSVKSEGSMIEWEAKWLEWCYFVLLERICKMFCFLITDFIAIKFKCC